MKTAIAVAVAALALACASTPPKMTDAERHARASVVFVGNKSEAVSTLTDYFLEKGYQVDEYQEATGIISTGWRKEDMGSFYKAVAGQMEQRLQARLRPRDDSTTSIEIWIFNRFDGKEEELNLYAARYDDELAKLKAYLSSIGKLA